MNKSNATLAKFPYESRKTLSRGKAIHTEVLFIWSIYRYLEDVKGISRIVNADNSQNVKEDERPVILFFRT